MKKKIILRNNKIKHELKRQMNRHVNRLKRKKILPELGDDKQYIFYIKTKSNRRKIASICAIPVLKTHVDKINEFYPEECIKVKDFKDGTVYMFSQKPLIKRSSLVPYVHFRTEPPKTKLRGLNHPLLYDYTPYLK